MRSVQEATSSYDCKFPNCTNEARSRVGRHSYCSEHGGSQLRALARQARDIEASLRRAARLTREAAEATRRADVKHAAFLAAYSELIGDEPEGGST